LKCVKPLTILGAKNFLKKFTFSLLTNYSALWYNFLDRKDHLRQLLNF